MSAKDVVYRGNTLNITAESVSLLHNPALSTAPFNMLTSTDVS